MGTLSDTRGKRLAGCIRKSWIQNAIYAQEAPTDDPSWSLEDARHSAIVYKPSDIPNASDRTSMTRVPEKFWRHTSNWYHNVMSLLRNWYMIQAGTIDEAARKMQFDDELMGQLIRFVSSQRSRTYPRTTPQLRFFAHRSGRKTPRQGMGGANGHTPSIMDYARFNYVAQPEDSITRKGIFHVSVYTTNGQSNGATAGFPV